MTADFGKFEDKLDARHHVVNWTAIVSVLLQNRHGQTGTNTSAAGAGESHLIKLYAFLGNHGREYRGNRHNVAWQFLETLPFYGSLTWDRKFKGRVSSLETASGRIWLLMPETYMNRSGESISELMKFYRIESGELLAVHDELELPLGTFGFKLGGGLGGHNGLRSIESSLGSRDFARLRFGIGRPDHPDIAGYVLSNFSDTEREILETSVFPAAARALLECIDAGFDSVLKNYAKIKVIP
jgi:PTH1 family peptidyl-tRNA hydrolase